MPGDVLVKPVGRREGFCGLGAAEFHLGHDQRGKGRVEDVQLDGEFIICRRGGKTLPEGGIRQGDQVSFLGDDVSVRLFPQVKISFPVQGQIVFLPRHHAAAFVGENIFLILLADSDHRIGTKITLLDMTAGIAVQVGGKFFDRKFSFNFHDDPSVPAVWGHLIQNSDRTETAGDPRCCQYSIFFHFFL